MSSLLANDWIVIPAVAIGVFVVCYLWTDRILSWLHVRSLGQREEILRLLNLMFIDVDRKRVTQMMMVGSFGLGALIFLLLWPNVGLGFVFGSVVTISMWSIPKIYVQNMWEKRCNKFVDQMVDGMSMMANGVRVGLSVQQCLERVEKAMPNPISQEFGLVLGQMRVGRALSESLNELGTRIPRPDVQMFVTSVNILQETGGNMAETFQTITFTIRERQKLEKKIEALTAQGVTQGAIITMIPFLLLVVFFALDPAYVMPLFTTTMGLFALFIMLTLQVVGGLMIRKMVKIDV